MALEFSEAFVGSLTWRLKMSRVWRKAVSYHINVSTNLYVKMKLQWNYQTWFHIENVSFVTTPLYFYIRLWISHLPPLNKATKKELMGQTVKQATLGQHRYNYLHFTHKTCRSYYSAHRQCVVWIHVYSMDPLHMKLERALGGAHTFAYHKIGHWIMNIVALVACQLDTNWPCYGKKKSLTYPWPWPWPLTILIPKSNQMVPG